MNGIMNELWLFIVWNNGNTWTRALVPQGIATARDLISYLQRGGKVVSEWMEIDPQRALRPARGRNDRPGKAGGVGFTERKRIQAKVQA